MSIDLVNDNTPLTRTPVYSTKQDNSVRLIEVTCAASNFLIFFFFSSFVIQTSVYCFCPVMVAEALIGFRYRCFDMFLDELFEREFSVVIFLLFPQFSGADQLNSCFSTQHTSVLLISQIQSEMYLVLTATTCSIILAYIRT